MYIEKLDDTNFILYCAKHYNNKQCTGTEEFYEDLKRIKYIKKLITRYEITGELKDHLILNHIIILNNVFGPVATVRILFFKMPQYLHYLKPFLLFINILPSLVFGIGTESVIINTDEIKMDQGIIDSLRKI